MCANQRTCFFSLSKPTLFTPSAPQRTSTRRCPMNLQKQCCTIPPKTKPVFSSHSLAKENGFVSYAYSVALARARCALFIVHCAFGIVHLVCPLWFSYPPANAGSSTTVSPSFTFVSKPFRKRMSSLFKKMLMCDFTCPCESNNRSLIVGYCAVSVCNVARTFSLAEISTVESPFVCRRSGVGILILVDMVVGDWRLETGD